MLTVVFAEKDNPVDAGQIDYPNPLPNLHNVQAWQDFLSTPLIGGQFKNLLEVLEDMARQVAEELSAQDHQTYREISIWVQHPNDHEQFYQIPVAFNLFRKSQKPH